MSRLGKLVNNSKVNEINIKYGKEKFSFNLNEELSITPSRINEELKSQPSYYGFLLLLRNRLLTTKEDKERESEKVYSMLYQKYCEKINPKTNRPYADKNAKELVIGSKRYNEAKIEFIKAKQDFNDIDSCVRAFEQRATLIQTLAANLRKEQ